MKKILIIIFALSILTAKSQTNYYVSSSIVGGTGSGLSQANAFNSLSDVSLIVLVPGDTVFLKCGDTFQEDYNFVNSGNSTFPIVFTSYGSGAKPIVSGSIALDSWTPIGGGIETNGFVIPILNLIVNNQQEEIAKYPDNGFLYVETGTTNTGFTDVDLPALPDYDGAKVCVGTSLWTWESQTVSNHTGTSITFGGLTNQPSGGTDFNNYGYFFFGREDLITVPSEWAWDSGAGAIYYYPSTGINTSTDDIQGTTEYTGFWSASNVDYITISNIEFKNQYQSGIEFTNASSSNIVIDNCDFNNIVEYGVLIEGTDNLITNCNFNNIDGRSIHGENCDGLEISYNIINNNGQYRNYGIADEDNLAGICVYSGDDVFIHHNVLDSIGYIGIRCDGTNSIVERNKISNYMSLLTDGGALKSYGSFSQNVIYRNNIAYNGIFNHDGAPAATYHIVSAALYFDFHVQNCTYENNVVYGDFETGIFLNGGADHSVIRGNIIYGGSHQIILNDRFSDPDTIYADTVEYNKCFTLADSVVSIRINSQNNYNVGIIDNNWYFNPYSDANIGKLHGTIGGMPGIPYSFSGWQSVLGFDANSKKSFVSWTSSENYSELFVNDTDNPMTFILGPNKYLDLDSNLICEEITVAPYYAEILINTGIDCGLDVPKLNKNQFLVYPNPAHNFLTIQSENNELISSLEIYSVTGNLVYSKHGTSDAIIFLDIELLASGPYFLNIKTENSNTTIRFVKE